MDDWGLLANFVASHYPNRRTILLSELRELQPFLEPWNARIVIDRTNIHLDFDTLEDKAYFILHWS